MSSQGFLGPPEAEDSRQDQLLPVNDDESPEAQFATLPLVTETPASPVHSTLSTTPPTPALLGPLPSPARSSRSSIPDSRRRQGPEARNNNRLSGFFSNFINRRPDRDALPPTPPPQLSRTPSPDARRDELIPQARPITPPPSVPPPTLSELGLSISVLTANLAPAHFSDPPNSGVFLAPRYLLLCHSQGLDVLPLISPPAAQPFAIVRKVNFKTIVVMEERGVLVAIAGRRDSVRVYALEEVRKAIESRMELETWKEQERARKEGNKRLAGRVDQVFSEKRPSTADGLPMTRVRSQTINQVPPGSRRASMSARSAIIPRSPLSIDPDVPIPSRPPGPPPAYVNSSSSSPRPALLQTPSVVSLRQSTSARRSTSSTESSNNGIPIVDPAKDVNDKGVWAEGDESSDDEAINEVAAGPSGSAALDERTSAMSMSRIASSNAIPPAEGILNRPVAVTMPSTISRRARPTDLDLSRSQTSSAVVPQGSPSPTLLTLRQALMHLNNELNAEPDSDHLGHNTADVDDEDDPDDLISPPGREQISFAQALMESRVPSLPPPGSRVPQNAILLGNVRSAEPPSRPTSPVERQSSGDQSVGGRSRRRWSVLNNVFGESNRPAEYSRAGTPEPGRQDSTVHRSMSARYNSSAVSSRSAFHTYSTSIQESRPSLPAELDDNRYREARHSGNGSHNFIPRLFSAFGSRRSEDSTRSSKDGRRKGSTIPLSSQMAPPKLDSVKLPGTRGALLIKAVETPKKSFLAILCGDAGEKVELFAGTYRTALSLSRTFILPDSPRSLELQLQGDDLVEVFLMFSQNVFGLEPATVRVREVRIGRAERRAARRRAREARTPDEEPDPLPPGDETSVSVSIGVAVPNRPSDVETAHPVNVAEERLDDVGPAQAPTEEYIAMATANMGPYTTFQQLSFSPAFPLATIAEDCVIPPTYPSFVRHRAHFESSPDNSTLDLPSQHFSPPGLPAPPNTPPSKWYYRDLKGVVQGPWKSSLMQQWFRDGLLPLDLPIRRDTDTEYTLLRDLRQQATDPNSPFRAPLSTLAASTSMAVTTEVPSIMDPKPLLPPISLLSQARHFGPPPLFFSTRGGHSTAIVDARGRSVLKGRLMWSLDEDNDHDATALLGKLGDVKRLEAFDVRDRAVIVALRQGGLEAADVGDALQSPADESRAYIPNYQAPTSGIGRRGTYVWRIGGPLAVPAAASPVASHHVRDTPTRAHFKKYTSSHSKPSAKSDFLSNAEDSEYFGQDEVLFLGRQDDNMYLCERSAGTFRILKVSPS
ncbi:hypothetical protein SISNIDRAFT_454872 [Sistotremastrum niveocremeum HHB9708]|uniref:GYF domain-containing protein n=1 Tax=Sistotremastrum niveocremeum HHB9708 TaxID=1314777 RepID=A0A164U5D1_9AGAM|nr:hypothetical protein SISNIDRAFT_454872 [Sistotremastrum niveocremeum HHB9708]